jgi:hypothetical protein
MALVRRRSSPKSPMPTSSIAVRVIASPRHVLSFLLERFLDDQARRQLHQLALIRVRRTASVK